MGSLLIVILTLIWIIAKHFSVVHNGIIENYHELRNFLTKQGYNFLSETDSEVVPI